MGGVCRFSEIEGGVQPSVEDLFSLLQVCGWTWVGMGG